MNGSNLAQLKLKRAKRIKTQTIQHFPLTPAHTCEEQDVEGQLSDIVIQGCQKCRLFVENNNMKAAKYALERLQLKARALKPSHPQYPRLMSLVHNTKATYYGKNGQNQHALAAIDAALSIQTDSDLDTITRARTILNKSVLIGQMARLEPQKYTHQEAIKLAKQALQMLRNGPEHGRYAYRDQYKLGEIIIISFHNIATELMCLRNEEQGYGLYRKAYDLAFRVLGPRHSLTCHLRGIVGQYRHEKSQKKRVLTENVDRWSETKHEISLVSSKGKTIHRLSLNSKNMTEAKINNMYGISPNKTKYTTLAQKQGKIGNSLTKSHKMYQSEKKNTAFPFINKNTLKKELKIERNQKKGFKDNTSYLEKVNKICTETPTNSKLQAPAPKLTIPKKQQNPKPLQIQNTGKQDHLIAQPPENQCQLI